MTSTSTTSGQDARFLFSILVKFHHRVELRTTEFACQRRRGIQFTLLQRAGVSVSGAKTQLLPEVKVKAPPFAAERVCKRTSCYWSSEAPSNLLYPVASPVNSSFFLEITVEQNYLNDLIAYFTSLTFKYLLNVLFKLTIKNWYDSEITLSSELILFFYWSFKRKTFKSSSKV